jgi:hypothetical protein
MELQREVMDLGLLGFRVGRIPTRRLVTEWQIEYLSMTTAWQEVVGSQTIAGNVLVGRNEFIEKATLDRSI